MISVFAEAKSNSVRARRDLALGFMHDARVVVLVHDARVVGPHGQGQILAGIAQEVLKVEHLALRKLGGRHALEELRQGLGAMLELSLIHISEPTRPY